MGPVEKEHDKIEAYLAGGMTSADRADVESRMMKDEPFRLRVAIHREAQAVLGDEAAHQFRSALAEVHQEITGETTGLSQANEVHINQGDKPWRRILSIAASIAILLVAGYWFVDIGSPKSSEDLAIAYMEPYTLPGSFRGENEQLVTQALDAYEKQDYRVAFELYDQLAVEQPDNLLHAFAAGVSALLAGQPAKAEELLKPIKVSNDLLLSQQARWYLGLSLLSQDRVAEAKLVFEEIGVGEYQYEKAQRVLEEI